MGGKLPIDRVRDAEHANQPRYDFDKAKLAKKDAELQREAREYADGDPDKAGAPDPGEAEVAP